MAVDMFLKLDDIKGESQDKVHKDEVDVLAWSWGMSQSGNMHMGMGGGAGKVNVQDLSVTKYIDKSSTVLMQKICEGGHFKKAILTVRKAGGKEPVEYVIITLEDVIVSSYSTGGTGGEDKLTENVSLNFAKVKVKYTPQKEDGTADASSELGWNIAENADY